METAVKKLYEGMFLIDSALAAQDWQKVIDEIQRMMKRAEADVVSLKKWDDRRMTYPIQGKSRGTYILVYFNCDPDKVKGVERDVQLSELIMRVMILRTDRMTQADMDKPTPLETAPADPAAVSADSAPDIIADEAETLDDEPNDTETAIA